jgi:phosphoglycerate dehydrogenase-like enzyme
MEKLDELLATSDHVVLCLPFLEPYRRLLDARRISLLKNGAYFYNVGRGALIDQAVLLKALSDGRLAGAALDVFEQEPLPSESAVWDTPNLLITPHIAGHDRDLRGRCLQLFQKNFERYVSGLPLFNQIDQSSK